MRRDRRIPSICRHRRATLRWTCPACFFAPLPLGRRDAVCLRVPPGARRAAREALRGGRNTPTECAISRRQAGEFAACPSITPLATSGARKGIEKIKERLAQIDEVRAQYETERSRRHLVAARGALTAWSRLVDPAVPELVQAKAEVTDGLLALALDCQGRVDRRVRTPHAAKTLYARPSRSPRICPRPATAFASARPNRRPNSWRRSSATASASAGRPRRRMGSGRISTASRGSGAACSLARRGRSSPRGRRGDRVRGYDRNARRHRRLYRLQHPRGGASPRSREPRPARYRSWRT